MVVLETGRGDCAVLSDANITKLADIGGACAIWAKCGREYEDCHVCEQRDTCSLDPDEMADAMAAELLAIVRELEGLMECHMCAHEVDWAQDDWNGTCELDGTRHHGEDVCHFAPSCWHKGAT